MLTITEKKFQSIIRALPRKERAKLDRRELTEEELEERIVASSDAMKRDLWVGIPWFLMYSTSLYMFGFTAATLTLLLLGAAYFIYSFIKFGSYGLNRLRVKVYRQLLEAGR